MKLTKLQRHTAYIIMLEEAEKLIYRCGFCWMIFKLFGFGNCVNDFNIKNYFPELYKKRPKNIKLFWFPTTKTGWKERIKLLKQCIKETA